jgi:hypothetical protein
MLWLALARTLGPTCPACRHLEERQELLSARHEQLG